MLTLLTHIQNTVVNRPYVVAFLLVYLVLSIRCDGVKKSLAFLILGYTVAFISEFSSINTGFPYGWYYYVYENLQNDWLFYGVPVWDSVSYVFMCYAGLYVAHRSNPELNKWSLVTLSAFLTMLLDISIDPVAHQGANWFLGEIYQYPFPGFYFDIPLSNFGGWFMVSFVINALGVFLLNLKSGQRDDKLTQILGWGLYAGIFCFGLVIAIYLQSVFLIICDVLWIVFILILTKQPPHLEIK